MIFNSFNFIFLFLPTFLLSYFIAGDNFKNVIIFLYSILYYVFGNINNPIYIVILVGLTIINYLFYYIIFIENYENKKRVKLAISILFNVAVIVIFKAEIIFRSMPVGLSFYVFHYISILVDTYKKDVGVQKINFLEFVRYIVFFPKLLSGPITRYDYFNKSYSNKEISLDNFIKGMYIFTIGLSLKCILSDNIYNIINQINVYGYDSISIYTAWVGMISFTMNLYFDFAGYSLMAIGLAKSIGMSLPDNFNLPFYSKSISEFWRRWHITLGHFFRDYVYIPLGGNCGNKNLPKQIFNIIVVWALTGLWHGLKINYILWAMSVCFLIVLEKVFLLKVYNKCEIIGRLIVILFIPFTFLIFSIENFNYLKVFISKLYDISSTENIRDFVSIYKSYYKIFIIGLVFMTSVPKMIFTKLLNSRIGMIIITIVLFILSCYMMSINSADIFKYFTF